MLQKLPNEIGSFRLQEYHVPDFEIPSNELKKKTQGSLQFQITSQRNLIQISTKTRQRSPDFFN